MAGPNAPAQHSPGLFDVAQDITGGLPLELIEQWLASDQTPEDAAGLLAPHRVRGFNVVSDSAGLARLTQDRGLLELLAIIDQPKEIVHRVGAAIGGRGVGVWAADNTQMFYGDAVAAAALVAALLTIQDTIRRECLIKIGLGAHFGEFYDVAGGLYGEASDAIEEFAENATDGGEIAISQAVVDRLPADHGFTLVERPGGWRTLGAVYTVIDGPRLEAVPDRGGHYPIPYSEAFHADLRALAADLDDAALAEAITRKYTAEKTVVLIEREPEFSETHEATLLNTLAYAGTMRDTGARLLDGEHGEAIKVTGGVGVYTFDDAARALEFAERFRRELSGDGIHCRIGLDRGPVLVFSLASGAREIAGAPVHYVARLTQERGSWGRLYLSDRVYEKVDVRGFQPITCTIAGVDTAAFEG